MNDINKSKREFLTTFTGVLGFGAIAGLSIASLQSQMPKVTASNPFHDVDFGMLAPGEIRRMNILNQPIDIRRLSQAEFVEFSNVPRAELRDLETIFDRTRNLQRDIVVVNARCTKFGCVSVANAGDYDGWFCPCCGSHYDALGRIRKNSAPKNLAVPPIEFTSETSFQMMSLELYLSRNVKI